MNVEGTMTGRMYHVTKTLDGRSIDKLSEMELRHELRSMIKEAARLERGAKCFHENVRSVDYVENVGNPVVTVYTCRDCNLSWSD
jgi:hypothetical protein